MVWAEMRKRQILVQNAVKEIENIYGPGYATIVNGSVVFKWPQKVSQEATIERPKGTCKKCGKHIGRGIGLHERKCQ